MQIRDYSFIGTTQSLCPECLRLVPAKIIERRGRVYFRKQCPEHGQRDDFVCSDVTMYDRMDYVVPAKVPAKFGVEPDKGCPFDCGLCTEHEQHTCIGLVEITSSCNLSCSMCYAISGPGGQHLPFEECKKAIDRLVEVEGGAEVLQISGGEPTIHPEFRRILDYAVSQDIDYIQINTNGIRLAHDPDLVETLSTHKDHLEIFFQLDGLDPEVTKTLRGEDILDTKLHALEMFGEMGVHVTLAVTLQGGVNEDQCGPLVKYALERPWITGINFQPATYSGRYYLPEDIEKRITFPDVVRYVSEQTDGLFQAEDFMPLPCAHPNCHSLAYAFRSGETTIPLTRFIDAKNNLDLLANGISFTREKSRDLILQYLGRQGCCSGSEGCGPELTNLSLPGMENAADSKEALLQLAGSFFEGVLSEELGAADLFRITITSFLDAYNFDVRRVMKCCTHHVLPSGHVIPFCAYNVLYREGHVALPELTIAELSTPPA